MEQSQVLQPTTGLPAGSTTVRLGCQLCVIQCGACVHVWSHANCRCNGCGKARLHRPTRDEYGARVAQTYYRCERFAVCANCFDRMFRQLADQTDAGARTIPTNESLVEEHGQVVASAAPDVSDADMDEKT